MGLVQLMGAEVAVLDHKEHDARKDHHGVGPRQPADEAVDRVPTLRLRERELVAVPIELVRAVLQSIRPRR